jgi:hypothetical protein
LFSSLEAEEAISGSRKLTGGLQKKPTKKLSAGVVALGHLQEIRSAAPAAGSAAPATGSAAPHFLSVAKATSWLFLAKQGPGRRRREDVAVNAEAVRSSRQRIAQSCLIFCTK